MEHPDEDGRPADPAAESTTDLTAHRFAAIVRALELEDPAFVRRVSAPRRRRLAGGNLMIVLALVATVVLGAGPLVLGLHLGVTALVVVGAVGCLALPVGVPLAVGLVLRRMRPLIS